MRLLASVTLILAAVACQVNAGPQDGSSLDGVLSRASKQARRSELYLPDGGSAKLEARSAPSSEHHHDVARRHQHHKRMITRKRWVWGPSIIQDDTPMSAIPPQQANTPQSAPVAPTFPPVSQASVAEPLPTPESSQQSQPVAMAADTVATSSSSSNDIGAARAVYAPPATSESAVAAAAAAAETTSSAVDVAAARGAARAAAVRGARNPKAGAKRWIWGSSIIQDDSPGASTIGTSDVPSPCDDQGLTRSRDAGYYGSSAASPQANVPVAPTFPAQAPAADTTSSAAAGEPSSAAEEEAPSEEAPAAEEPSSSEASSPAESSSSESPAAEVSSANLEDATVFVQTSFWTEPTAAAAEATSASSSQDAVAMVQDAVQSAEVVNETAAARGAAVRLRNPKAMAAAASSTSSSSEPAAATTSVNAVAAARARVINRPGKQVLLNPRRQRDSHCTAAARMARVKRDSDE